MMKTEYLKGFSPEGQSFYQSCNTTKRRLKAAWSLFKEIRGYDKLRYLNQD